MSRVYFGLVEKGNSKYLRLVFFPYCFFIFYFFSLVMQGLLKGEKGMEIR